MLALALLVLGAVERGKLPWAEHGLMMPAMLVPMLLRFDLYSGHTMHRPVLRRHQTPRGVAH